MSGLFLPPDVVDLCRPRTWPSHVTRAVRGSLSNVELDGDVAYYDELDLPVESRAEILGALQGLRIVCYHATRLMQHEVEDIRSGGLRPLSPELVQQRLQEAVRRGALSTEVAEELIAPTLVNAADASREGSVWFTASRDDIQQTPNLWRMYRYWGGEVMRHHLREGDRLHALLGQVGQAAVVLAAIESDQLNHYSNNVDLARGLLAVRLGLEPNATVAVAEVLPTNILSVVCKGSADWEGLAPKYQKH